MPARYYRIGLLVSVAMMLPTAALAQSTAQQPSDKASPQTVDTGSDIVVTATRQATGAQSVPIALTAIGGDQLAKQGITDSSQLQQLAPSLYVVEGLTASAPRYAIRGVTGTDDGVAATPAVATYIDDVYQSQQFGVGQQIFDLQRVEVLRGPQGTTFGKNTTAGAIAFFSQTPKNEAEGYVTARLGGGDQSRRSIEAAVNVPIVADTLALRVSGRMEDKGDWVRDAILDEGYGKSNSASGRFQLRWMPDADTSVNLTLYGTRTRGDSGNLYSSQYLGDPCSLPTNCPNGTPIPIPPANGDAVAITDLPITENVDNGGAVLRIEHDFGAFNITSITNYRKTKFRNRYDVDGLPADIFDYFFSFDTKQYGQELRLAADPTKPLSGIFGLFYQYDDGADNSTIGSVYNEPSDFLTAYNSLTKTKTFGIFGNATYKFTASLSGTVGVRKSIERRSLRGFNDYYFSGDFNSYDLTSGVLPGPSDVRTQYDVRANSSPWTWDATLNYNPHRDLLIYARAAKGFRSGGFTISPFFSPDPLPSTFKPETIQSYEAGIKLDLLDRRLRVNASAFHYDYKNQQVSSLSNASFLTTNAAKSKINGFELEVTAKPVDGFELRGAIGYSDAKYGTYVFAPGVDYSGNQMTQTPKWTANGTASYTVPVSAGLELQASTTWSYRGKVFFEPSNDPLVADKARTYGNLRLALTPVEGKGFSLAAYANNITNQKTLGYAYTFQPAYVARVFTPGGSYGVEVGFRW